GSRRPGVTSPGEHASLRSSLSALIGRPGARQSFWGVTPPVSQPPGRKARRPDPPYVFGAASPAATATNEPRGVSAAKSLRDSLNAFATAQEKRQKRARSGCAPLTGGAIYVGFGGGPSPLQGAHFFVNPHPSPRK